METSAAKSSASLFLFSFFLWVFVRGITVSSKIDKHAELYVPDLQLVIRCRWVPSPSARAAYIMESIDVFLFIFLLPSTLREMTPGCCCRG